MDEFGGILIFGNIHIAIVAKKKHFFLLGIPKPDNLRWLGGKQTLHCREGTDIKEKGSTSRCCPFPCIAEVSEEFMLGVWPSRRRSFQNIRCDESIKFSM